MAGFVKIGGLPSPINYLDRSILDQNANIHVTSKQGIRFCVNQLVLVSHSRMFYHILKNSVSDQEEFHITVLTDFDNQDILTLESFIMEGIVPPDHDKDKFEAVFRAFGMEIPVETRQESDLFDNGIEGISEKLSHLKKPPLWNLECRRETRSCAKKRSKTKKENEEEWVPDLKRSNSDDSDDDVENENKKETPFEKYKGMYVIAPRDANFELPNPPSFYFIPKEDSEIKKVKVNSSGFFKCNLCNTGFDVNRALLAHITADHLGQYKCPHCDEFFVEIDFDKFKHHVYLHMYPEKAKNYQCNVCGFRAKKWEYMRRHFDGRSPFHVNICTQCPEKLTSYDQYKEHVRTVHNDVWVIQCGKCGENCESQKQLNKHHYSKHRTKSNRDIEYEEKSMIKEQKVVCDVCGLEMGSEVRLNGHKLRIHMEKNLVCPDCPFRTACKDQLMHHRRQMHIKSPCIVCGQLVVHNKLKRHYLKEHTDPSQYPYKCSVCNKGFIKPGPMKEHMNLHTGERPFKCRYCGKTFACKGNKAAHERQIHEGKKRKK